LLTVHTKLLRDDQGFHLIAPVHRGGSSVGNKLPTTLRWGYPSSVPFFGSPFGTEREGYAFDVKTDASLTNQTESCYPRFKYQITAITNPEATATALPFQPSACKGFGVTSANTHPHASQERASTSAVERHSLHSFLMPRL
jgi:hypothetical protein